MPSIEIEVWCSCGYGLCRQTKIRGCAVTVEPCEDCLDKARDEASYEEHKAGHDEGFKRGEDVGFTKGHGVGYDKGHDAGYDEGYKAGLDIRTS